jgi:CRP-like cAMP-binding protein/Flp pilus assembly protein TadD
MVMNLFSGKEASVAELIAKKKFSQAIDALKQQLARRPNDTHLQIQLADVLALDGRVSQAVSLMEKVVDQLASEGFTTKAVAALKRVEKLDPSRDISGRLKELVQDMGGGEPRRMTSPGLALSTESDSSIQFDLDDSEAVPVEFGEFSNAEQDQPVAAESPEADSPSAPPAPKKASGMRSSPLFSSFPDDELLEILSGFDVVSFSPGDIVVTEGEVGESLFVIANGFVKAWVRTPNGGSVKVRDMHEGEFFGEIALLTRKPRTATVIAAAHSELLELDRATLDQIAQRRPHVRQVILEFYHARANTATATMLQGMDIEEPPSAQPEPVPAPVEVTLLPDATPPEVSAADLKENAIAATRSSNFEQAFGLWTRFLEECPDDLHALNALGIAAAKLSRWEETASAFQRVLKQAPNDPAAHFSLGVAYWRMSRIDDAKNSFRETLKFKPDHEKAAQSLAKLGG